MSHRCEPIAFTVPKVERQRNEDWYQYSSKGVVAISDGASISFDSASWARILARRFARRPELTSEWLSDAIAEFGTLHDREELPWMMQAAYDRGSFASLLGVRFIDGQNLELSAIGDSLAVLCDGDNITATFPYSNASQFDQSPQLLCTNPAENAFLRNGVPCVRWSWGELAEPALLCVTDALGQWLLARRETSDSPIAVLRKIETRTQFARFVQSERATGQMRRDDTTLLAFW